MKTEYQKVSVIIPTYNRSDVVCNAIDSALNQDYKDIEVIVVDDGSNDNTEAKLKKYADNIIYLKQGNKGVSAARNLGIRASTGDFISFIDSDDVWHKTKISKQIDFFIKNENYNVALVYTDVALFNNNVKSVKRHYVERNESGVLDLIDVFKDPYLGLPTVMIKADAIDRNSVFDESLETAEDIDLYLRLSTKYNIGYINEVLVDVYQTDDSLSSKLSSYLDNIKVVARFVDDHPDVFVDNKKIVEDILFKINYEYAKTLLWNGLYEEARLQLRYAHKYQYKLSSMLLYLKSYLKKLIYD